METLSRLYTVEEAVKTLIAVQSHLVGLDTKTPHYAQWCVDCLRKHGYYLWELADEGKVFFAEDPEQLEGLGRYAQDLLGATEQQIDRKIAIELGNAARDLRQSLVPIAFAERRKEKKQEEEEIPEGDFPSKGEIEKIVTSAGGEFIGLQDRSIMGKHPIILFNDPTTGNTIPLDPLKTPLTTESVMERIQQSRAKWEEHNPSLQSVMNLSKNMTCTACRKEEVG